MKKTIFFDIDGTLLGEKSGALSISTMNTLQKLQSNGHRVLLATGRSFHQTDEFAKSIHIKDYVCDGGNGIVLDNQVYSYEYPNQEVLHNVMRECEQMCIPYAIQIDNTNHRYHCFPDYDWDNMKTLFKNVYHCVEEDLTQHRTIKRIMVIDTSYQFKGLKDFGLMCHHNRSLTIVEPVDKYKGIKRLCELKKIDEKSIIVFGDGYNDMSMIIHAPFSVAMGNAVDVLKQKASYVCDDSDSNGIQKACEYLQLI